MVDENLWINKRAHPRINWSFIARYRPKDDASSGWEASTVKDISEGGCFFHSKTPYKIGDVLDVLIQFPALPKPMRFTGEVRRCESGDDKAAMMYGIGIKFLDMDEEKKKEFINTITFFLKKEQKKKG